MSIVDQLEVIPGDGHFTIRIGIQLLSQLADLVHEEHGHAVTIEPTYADASESALRLTVHHSDQKDGDYDSTHLLVAGGTVRLK